MLPELTKPDYVTQTMWDSERPDTRHWLVKDFPHPPKVWAVPCSGSTINKPKHLCQVQYTPYKWYEPFPDDPDTWSWIVDEDKIVPLTEWLPIEDLPSNTTYQEINYQVVMSPSHSLCPECDAVD